MTAVLKDSTPLEPDYLPRQVVDRDDELEALAPVFASFGDADPVNVFIHGARGAGKTHLTHLLLNELSDDIIPCYIPCTQYNTQYKVLKQLCQHLTDQPVGNGHHTSQLQHRFEQHTGQVQTVIVLDDIGFLLMNDGDDLLYFLSRGDHSENIAIVTISANTRKLSTQLEERTYSSLYPQRIRFEAYTAEQVYRILVERAQKSLTERSLRREALTYIASTTQNVSVALKWLKTAAENTDSTITESTVKDAKARAFHRYVDHLLEGFSDHHRLLFQAIQELTEKQESLAIRSGHVYDRYQDLCRTYSEDSLSTRRIGTYLKHLELLDIVEADYHYGGRQGKTREVRLDAQISHVGELVD